MTRDGKIRRLIPAQMNMEPSKTETEFLRHGGGNTEIHKRVNMLRGRYVEGTTWEKKRRRNHRTYEEDDAGYDERHGMERKEENAGVREIA